VPLPDAGARHVLFGALLKHNSHALAPEDLSAIVTATDGFSGADCRNLCQEAAMGPVRDVGAALFGGSSQVVIPPITKAHFDDALRITRPTVAPDEISFYEDWDRQFGTASALGPPGPPTTEPDQKRPKTSLDAPHH